eukprot:6148001-Heterocapsa_arctica.AAC.1
MASSSLGIASRGSASLATSCTTRRCADWSCSGCRLGASLSELTAARPQRFLPNYMSNYVW